MNPAALAPFVDVFALGDGERLVPRIAELLRSGLSRDEFLEAAARQPGFFVPAVQGPRAEAAESAKVVIQQPMSRKEITPAFEVPHTTILTPRTELADKLLIEISRGCTEMCRFCWAAYAMAPVKQYPAASILKVARAGARRRRTATGLIATAVCDHPEITTILAGTRRSSGTTSRSPPSRSTRSRTRSSRSSRGRERRRSRSRRKRATSGCAATSTRRSPTRCSARRRGSSSRGASRA